MGVGHFPYLGILKKGLQLVRGWSTDHKEPFVKNLFGDLGVTSHIFFLVIDVFKLMNLYLNLLSQLVFHMISPTKWGIDWFFFGSFSH